MPPQELYEDLIVEIIQRLPLKYVVQCSVLNKSLYHRISDRSFLRRCAVFSSINNLTLFHCSLRQSKIFSAISPHKYSVNLDRQTSIRASCNGLLLLTFNTYNSSYVFNPLTGGIAPTGVDLDFCHDVGLAVDLAANDYLVVTVHFARGASYGKSILEFSVNSPRMAVRKSSFVCDKLTLTGNKNLRSVYAHGCLHWLELDCRRMIAYDVEKEQARIIDGPVKETGMHPDADSPWFGFADGSMQFICALPNEIVIHCHDRRDDSWRVKHKIGNICSPSNNDYRYGMPLFFDGRQVFVYIRKRGEDGEVKVYDMVTKVWETRGYVRGWSNWGQVFFSFFPTLVTVSDKYLQEDNTLENAAHKRSLLELRGLLI